MPITDPAQLASLKTYLNANHAGLFDEEAAAEMNKPASPAYYVWSSAVSRSQVYNLTGAGGSTWDWTTYKNQSVSEQNAWTQMFMGDVANFGQLNVRVGISKIFTGSAGANAQRDHCFAVGKRQATVAEKLYAAAVTSPPANSGNDSGQAVGNIANPALLVFEGRVTADDVSRARQA